MRKLDIDGVPILIEMNWSFLPEQQINHRMADQGGIAINHEATMQFGQGDGTEDCYSLAAWLAWKVPNSLAVMPIDAKYCWLCGAIGGFIAPETDVVIQKEDLQARLELLEDIAPYDLYLIDVQQVDGEDVASGSSMDALLQGMGFTHLDHLTLSDMGDQAEVSGKNVSEVAQRKNPVYFAVIGLALLASGYLGYNWWQGSIKLQQQAENTADQQLMQRQQSGQQKALAEEYRSLHQAANVYTTVTEVLSNVQLESQGWDLEKVLISDSVTASYKRNGGLLATFLKGKKHVNWSEDGNSADIDMGKTVLPLPLRSGHLAPMSRVEAITMMQRFSAMGLEGTLLASAPDWASQVPAHPFGSGIKLIYWKVGASFAWLKSAMSLLQQSNVAVAVVGLNFSSKRCEIEGVIYGSS